MAGHYHRRLASRSRVDSASEDEGRGLAVTKPSCGDHKPNRYSDPLNRKRKKKLPTPSLPSRLQGGPILSMSEAPIIGAHLEPKRNHFNKEYQRNRLFEKEVLAPGLVVTREDCPF